MAASPAPACIVFKTKTNKQTKQEKEKTLNQQGTSVTMCTSMVQEIAQEVVHQCGAGEGAEGGALAGAGCKAAGVTATSCLPPLYCYANFNTLLLRQPTLTL